MAFGSFVRNYRRGESTRRRGESTRRGKAAVRDAAFRALVEPLEGRLLLTTTVTSHDAPPVTAGASSAETVTLTFTDDSGNVSAASIGSQNLVITPPNGATAPTVSVTRPASDASTMVVAYSLQPPAGGWSVGSYSVAVQPNVTDTNGTPVSNPPTFSFQSQSAQDTAPPTANIATPPDINAATNSPQTISVTYADDVGIDTSAGSINASNVTVSGPGGALITGTPTINGSGKSVTVTYPVAGPGGNWSSADSGQYTVTFNAGQVKDTSGNTAGAATAAHFNVNIAAADTTPPTAAISPPSNITTATSNAQVISITYTDNVGIDTSAASITSSNIIVSGTGEPLPSARRP